MVFIPFSLKGSFNVLNQLLWKGGFRRQLQHCLFKDSTVKLILRIMPQFNPCIQSYNDNASTYLLAADVPILFRC